MNRRDFLLGAAAGSAGTIAAGTGLYAAIDAKSKAKAAKVEEKPEFPKESWAQQGEDLIVANILREMLEIAKPTYLDIGAYDPVICNNTYLFYKAGSRGVLVEPNPRLAKRLHDERPDDKVLNVGIGVTDAQSADYFLFETDQVNTFDPEEAKKSQQEGEKLLETMKLPLVNINRVIADELKGRAPDLLSIDTEGWDLPILKSLDFEKFRPVTICTETLKSYSFETRDEIGEFLRSMGYVVRGMTFVNTIFVDGERLK